eukprot:s3511_g8.t1
MSFELTAFPLLGIERFLYGYIYQFPESFKRCCKGPLKSLLDYDEGVYWQVAKHLGVGIKVFQFGVLGYDLVLRRSLSLAEPRLLCSEPIEDAGRSLQKKMNPKAVRDQIAASRREAPASLLALWILGDHFIHRASVFTDRSNVAVAAFISLSLFSELCTVSHHKATEAPVAISGGFVTQWAYSTRDFSRVGTVFQYLVRRIGRVALTTYFAMLAAVGVLAVQTHIPSWRPKSELRNVSHMVRCFLFVETWLQPENWCPDGQSWTIAALLPSWLLYPSLKHLVGLMEKKLWMISAGPSLVVFLLQDGFLTNKQHNLAYLWPPSQMPDFAIGVFLFQQPLFNAFEILWIAGMNEVLPMWGFATIFLVTLYALSAIYAECIEAAAGSVCKLPPLSDIKLGSELELPKPGTASGVGIGTLLPVMASRILAVVLATAAVAALLRSEAFVSGVPQRSVQLPSKVALAAESSPFSLAEYPDREFENDENISNASIVFWGIFGLLLPLLGGFTTGLIFAALGWGLSTGGILSFVKKTKSIEEYADYVTQVSDLGKKGGEYGLKAYNFVAKKTGEMSK